MDDETSVIRPPSQLTMKLTTALRLEEGEIAVFVGDNGASSAMFRLAEEIVEAGGRVITTTTTRLPLAEAQSAPTHFSAFEVDRARLEAALAKKSHVLLTGPIDRERNEVTGVTLGLISSLRSVPDLTAILVRSAGSPGESLKALTQSGAGIPEETSLVVPVGGVEFFDQQSLQNISTERRVIPFINHVETPEQLAAARETAKYLLQSPAIISVALGIGRSSHPVREVHGRVAAIVLAAGRSARMGRPKQTLTWSGGKTMVGHIVHQLQAGEVDEVVVVTGSDREEVETALLADRVAVRLVFNPDFENAEMVRSLQIGLQAVSAGCMAVLVALGDQPQLEPDVARAVMHRWRETQAAVVAPVYQQRRGHPLLFDRSVWPGLLSLPPESNPREFVEAAAQTESPFGIEYVEAATDSILRDVDTPEDYQRERGRSGE